MDNPKISVITVCLNSAKTIEETILSVINQNYKNIEYIIIDGVSSDGTLDIIHKHKDRITKCISEKDSGIYDAMNKGLKYATGDYVIFIGADDVLYTNETLKKVALSINNYNDIIYGNVIFKNTSEIHWGKFNRLKWATSNICHQAIFYPRIVYSKYKYDPSFIVSADYLYNINLIKNGFEFSYINEIISYYDTTGISSSTSDQKFSKIYANVIIETFGVVPYILGIILRNIKKIKHNILILFYNKK